MSISSKVLIVHKHQSKTDKFTLLMHKKIILLAKMPQMCNFSKQLCHNFQFQG